MRSAFERKQPEIFGALAQLGERNTGSVEVSGSIPLGSTKYETAVGLCLRRFFCFGDLKIARAILCTLNNEQCARPMAVRDYWPMISWRHW
jgi:hypothetical protein